MVNQTMSYAQARDVRNIFHSCTYVWFCNINTAPSFFSSNGLVLVDVIFIAVVGEIVDAVHQMLKVIFYDHLFIFHSFSLATQFRVFGVRRQVHYFTTKFISSRPEM